ncbi:MAG: Na+/H+ antiporter subunit E, partial [Candidatus Omnitrophica bacterium]|nr:Na+/H+ antiporter subunit E [Candidatus Omnitrophota bacterium]
MKSRLTLFVLGFAVWSLLVWPLDLQHALVGIFVCGLVAILTGDMFIRRVSHFKSPARYFWFICFTFIFLWECLKANIDVALRVLNPKMPINPGIVKVKTTLKSETGLTFLANSITLTPGTLCVDIDQDNGFLYIHWIDVKSQDINKATELIMRKFEGILKRIF